MHVSSAGNELVLNIKNLQWVIISVHKRAFHVWIMQDRARSVDEEMGSSYYYGC